MENTDVFLSNNVTAIAIDGDYVWFGMRYCSYPPHHDNAVSILNKATNEWVSYTSLTDAAADNYVSGIAVDEDYVWVATLNGGVAQFDKTTKNWTILTTENSQLSSNYVSAIAVDEEYVWIGGDYGVSYLNKTTNQWGTYTWQNSGLLDNFIYTIAAEEEYVWFGVWAWRWWHGLGVAVLNKTTGEWTNYTVVDSGLISNEVCSIAIDKYEDCIWFGTIFGVSQYRREDVWQVYQPNEIQSNFISSIAADEDSIWLGTEHVGVAKLNKITGTVSIYTSHNSGLVDNCIRAIAVDDDFVWFGTYYGGLARLDKITAQWTTYTTNNSDLPDNNIAVVAIDEDYLWLSIWGYGVAKFNKTTNEWTFYNTENSGLVSNYVRTIAADDDYVWFGTNRDGIVRLNKNNNQWHKFTTQNSPLKDNHITSIVIDEEDIWIGTIRGGVAKFNKITNKWTIYTTENSGLPGNIISAIAKDEQFLYFATYYYDAAYNRWVGRGVAQFNKISGRWTYFTETNSGLVSDYIRAIAIDEDYVWFASENKGISRYKKLGDLLWTKNIQCEIVNDSWTGDVSDINLGTAAGTGKFYIKAACYSKLAQKVAQDFYYFYINRTPVYLFFRTDKEAYMPGEIITITGYVCNPTPEYLDGLTLIMKKNEEVILTANFDLAPYQTYTFTGTTTADSSFNLTGKVSSDVDIQATDYIIVEEPQLKVDIRCQEVVSSKTNTFTAILTNLGKIDVVISGWWSVNSLNNIATFTLKAGKIKYIEGEFKLRDDSTITLSLNNNIYTKRVELGEKVNVQILPQPVYSPGFVEIPFIISNSGKLDSEFELTFKLKKLGQSQFLRSTELKTTPQWCSNLPTIKIKSKLLKAHHNKIPSEKIKYRFLKDEIVMISSFYIPAGTETIEGWLVYQLSTGTYKIYYSYFRSEGSKEFHVMDHNLAKLYNISRKIEEGKLKIDISVKNIGANEFNGILQIDTGFYEQELPIKLAITELATFTFDTELAAPTGSYSITAKLLYNGRVIDQQQIEIILEPIFVIEEVLLPTGGFNIGEAGTVAVVLKNTGASDDAAKVKIFATELLDDEKVVWVKTNSTATVSFSLIVPHDFLDNTYKGIIMVSWEGADKDKIKQYERSFPLKINGIKIEVQAHLDKILYEPEELATLTLRIKNSSAEHLGSFSLSAKVNFNNYQEEKNFTLAVLEEKLLTFNIPISFEEEKIAYSIYTASGRALYINSIYVRKKQQIINLWTEKEVYPAGSNVLVYVRTEQVGTFSIAAFNFSTSCYLQVGTYTFSFFLPQDLISGSYYINYSFSNKEIGVKYYSYKFDVLGYTVKVLECRLNKKEYSAKDTIKVKLHLWTNKEFYGVFKGWAIRQAEHGLQTLNYTPLFEKYILFTSGDNIIIAEGTFSTTYAGVYKFIYEVYLGTGSKSRLLVGGSEVFDVGNFMIKNLKAENYRYINTTGPINITIEAVGYGTFTLEIRINGAVASAEKINITDRQEFYKSLYIRKHGTHTIEAILKDGTLISYRQIELQLVDTLAPTTTVSIEGKSFKVENALWVASSAKFSLLAEDAFEIKNIKYKIDTGTWTIYKEPFNITEPGKHTLYFYAIDEAGNIEETKLLEFNTMHPSSHDTTTEVHRLKIKIPAGAIEDDYVIIIKELQDELTYQIAHPITPIWKNTVYEVAILSAGKKISKLNKPIELIFYYKDEDLNGLSCETLKIYRKINEEHKNNKNNNKNNKSKDDYRAAAERWQMLPTSTVNKQQRCVSAKIKLAEELGCFTVMGYKMPLNSLEDLTNFPNPFNPLKEETIIQYHLTSDADVEILIFDLFGSLVKKFRIAAGEIGGIGGLQNRIKWDGKNSNGDIVSSGGYICLVVVKDSKNKTTIKKKHKILVVW